MPENKNPSVVNEGTQGSNYNLARGGLNKADEKYMDKLQKSFSNPSAGALPKSTYYPSADKSIQAGTFGSKSLGNLPIFVANQGLIPIGMIEAKRKAEQAAAIQEFAMFGPGNNEALDQYVELANPMAQEEFTSKIQTDINTWLDDAAHKLGGDYSKARLMAKYAPDFKNMIRGYQNYAKAYNQLYPEAVDVLARAADPVNNYVSDETVQKATQFIKNHDNLGTKSVEELNNYLGEFQAYMGIDKAVQGSLSTVGQRITSSVQEDFKLSTDVNKVIKTIEQTGFYTDTEIDQMVDDELESYPYIADDPKARAQFEKQFRAGIAKKEKITLTQVRKEYARRDKAVNNSFGIWGSDDSGFHGTKMTGITHDGTQQYNTEYVAIPSKNAQNRSTYMDINANDIVHIRNQRGEVIRGYFNTPLEAEPNRMYKDDNDELQVSSSINVSAMQTKVDPLTGADQGLKRGDMLFNVVDDKGETQVIDVIDLGGAAEVIVPEERVAGQFATQFGQDTWGNVVNKAEQTPTPKVTTRATGIRSRFMTMDEAEEEFGTGRAKRVREKAAATKDKTGVGTVIIEDIQIQNQKTGEWYTYDELIELGYDHDKIMGGLQSGKAKHRPKED